jgi:AcrR family transcriptional regulator
MAKRDHPSTTKHKTKKAIDNKPKLRKRANAHILSSRPTRREPTQERARFTVAAILQAAAEVIDDAGWANASTNRIAERAGVSIGSLYQYFANKEEILTRLVEEHRRDVHVVVGLALERLEDPSVPIEDALRELFSEMVRLHRADPVLTRILATEVPHHHGEKDHGPKSDHLVRWLQRLLEQRSGLRVHDPAAAAHVIAISMEALTRWLVHESPEDLDTESAVEEMVTMFTSYLTQRPPVRQRR